MGGGGAKVTPGRAVRLALGTLPLWGAVVADVGASLVVVANGLRLVRGRPVGAGRTLPLLAPRRPTPEDAPAAVAPEAARDTCGTAGDTCCADPE